MPVELVIIILIQWMVRNTESDGNYSYAPLSAKKNFFKAGRACHERGQSLPFRNSAALEHIMVQENISSCWMNIRLHNLEVWTWVDGTPERKFCSSCKGCGMISMTEETKLTGADCASTDTGFICETTGPCTNDNQLHCRQKEGKNILIGCSTKNWFTARSKCIKLAGKLLVVKDNNTLENFLKAILPNVECKPRQTDFFIGLRRVEWFAVGQRDEKENVDHTMWQDEHPIDNHECVEIVKTGVDSKFAWRTKDCFANNTVVCQRNMSVPVGRRKAERKGTAGKYSKEFIGIICFLGALAAVMSILLIISLKPRIQKIWSKTHDYEAAEQQERDPPHTAEDTRTTSL